MSFLTCDPAFFLKLFEKKTHPVGLLSSHTEVISSIISSLYAAHILCCFSIRSFLYFIFARGISIIQGFHILTGQDDKKFPLHRTSSPKISLPLELP